MSRTTWVESDQYFPERVSIVHGTAQNRSSLSVPLEDVADLIAALAKHDPSTPAPTPSEATDTVATPPVMRIEGTWLVEVVDEHTCGAGPGSGTGMHEPGCGLVPVLDLATLPGWDEHLTAAPSATREEVVDTLVMTRLSDYAGTDMAVITQAADSLLTRFNMTRKETGR